MKINLNEKASKIFSQLRQEFKERKLKNPDWDDIFSEIVCQIPKKEWQEQIECLRRMSMTEGMTTPMTFATLSRNTLTRPKPLKLFRFEEFYFFSRFRPQTPNELNACGLKLRKKNLE